MPVPDSSFSRRYGGREESSSSYSTYSSSRTTPSRSSYLYNSKLTSTLPPRPTYDRKTTDSGMPISRFLNTSSSTSIPRSSANYISTSTTSSSSSRTLSPIRTSVASYRRAFEGSPSVTDRIKSLEIGGSSSNGLDKDSPSNGCTSRFLQKIRDREREREASIKPSSSYGSRDRSGSGEFGGTPLSASSMILRDRGGSVREQSSSADRSKFDLRVRAASVMGRAGSPSPSSSSTSSILGNKRNGYARLGSIEVTPTSSSSTTDTTTTTTANSSSKSVPVLVAANNAMTNPSISAPVAAAAPANYIENGVANFSDEDIEQCSSNSSVLENDNGSCNEAFAATSAANIATNYPSSTNSSSLPAIINNRQNEQNGMSVVPKISNNSSKNQNNVLKKNDSSSLLLDQNHQSIKNSTVSSSHNNIISSNNKSSKSRSNSLSPEKDSNGNTIIGSPIISNKEKVVLPQGERLVQLKSSSSSHKNANYVSNETCGSAPSPTSEQLNSNNNNQNQNHIKSITNNLKARRSSSTQTGAAGASASSSPGVASAGETKSQPKVIYHAIKLERNNSNESSESQMKLDSQKSIENPRLQQHRLSNGNANMLPPTTNGYHHIDNNQQQQQQQTNNNKNDDDEAQQNHEQHLLPNISKEENNKKSVQLESQAGVGLSSSPSTTSKNYLNQEKVKKLINNSSRSPSPAATPPTREKSASPSVLASSHLPSLNNSNNFVNGESSNNVEEMAGPHASKHLKGGAYTRPLNSTTPDLNQFSPMSSSRGYDHDNTNAASTSTRPRIHFNNPSDTSSSDNDSDTSSPSTGGRFRSSREKEKGLSGLRNIGNTCFMNSVVQCLSNTKPLLEYLLKDGYISDVNSTSSNMHGALMRAFASVIQELWSDTKSVVDTSAFKDQIQRFAPRFMGYSQQDAQEFLRYLLEGLHEDVNRVTIKPAAITTEIDDSLSDNQIATEAWKRYLRFDDSKIVDLFVGQFKSTLKCTVCGHCSVTFDPFWDLSLPIPSKAGQTRLSQCLELFTREEILDGDEKPTCSKCQARRKCTKSLSIQKFPKVLVIHLKRFSPMERYRGKLSTTVDFPMTGLDMTPYAANRNQGCTYNLYGVSNHSGSTYSGHYIAYCKHPFSGEWYCYNDSRVSSMSPHNVVSSDGYVLFYELASQSSHL